MTKQHFLFAGVTLVLVGIFGVNYYQQDLAGQLLMPGQIQVFNQPNQALNPGTIGSQGTLSSQGTVVVEEPGDTLDPNEVVAIVQNEDGTTTEYTRAQMEGGVLLVDDTWQDPDTDIDTDTEVEEPGDGTMLISDVICTNIVVKPPTKVGSSGKVLPKEYVKTTTTTGPNPRPPPKNLTKTTTQKAMIAARCTQKRAEFAAKEDARNNFIEACRKASKLPDECPKECLALSVSYNETNALQYEVKSNLVNLTKKQYEIMDCANNKEDAGGVAGQAWVATATIKNQDCTVTRRCIDRPSN